VPQPTTTAKPCFYLGPAGQRCERPAGEDGFCDRHSPQRESEGWSKWLRWAGALILLIALLWPLLADLLRQVGWLR
jgi:hypothetical protein